MKYFIMNISKIAKNLHYSLLSQIITIFLGLVIPRLILVGYGSETNGLLNSVAQVIIYLNLFEAGVQLVAVQSLYKPVSMDDKESINGILSAVNRNYKKTGAVYMGMLLMIALVYPYLIADCGLNYWTVCGVVLFSGLGNVVLFFFQGKYKILLQAEGKNYILTNLQTIIAVLNNGTKIICIALGYDVLVVVVASFVISLLQTGYIWLLIRKKYSWIDLNSDPDYDAIAQRNSALVHQLAGMVFQNTDVLIITCFCGLKVVSVYSIYKLITSHLGSLLNSLYGSISFALGQKFNTDRKAFSAIIDTVDVYFGGISFSVYTVTAILFLPFVELYTRGIADIAYSDKTICLLFVVIELLTFARLPMLNTINYAGHFQNTLPQTLIETSINLIISLTAVRFLGIYGVLLGTVGALIYRDIEVFLYTNHRILNRSARKTFFIYCVDALVFILILFAITTIPITVTSYFDFVKAGLILMPAVTLIYLSVLSFFFSGEKREVLRLAKETIQKLH